MPFAPDGLPILPFCSGALADLALVPELAAAAAPKPTGEIGGSVPPKGSSSSGSGGSKAARLPQPVDMVVPVGVGVVAVTGEPHAWV